MRIKNMVEKIDPEPEQVPTKRNSMLLEKAAKLLKKAFGAKSSASFEQSVSELIKEHDKDDSVHKEEKVILQNIITFGDLEADDVMVPRSDIIAVPLDVKREELEQIFIKHGHSRVPVYNGTIDNIIGFIHLKDFFKVAISKERFNIKNIIREMIYVPASIKITDLLSRMKTSSVHIAIVLDEYSATDGLVTIEDILEQVLGEIKDEYGEEEIDDDIRFEGNYIIIDAKVKMNEVGKALNLKLPTNNVEYDTFGGFVITYLGRIPVKGEKITHTSGLEIEILDADSRKIKTIRIPLKQKQT